MRHSFIRPLICVNNRIGRTQLGNYLFSDSKVSRTIVRKTDSLHVHVFGLRPVCAIYFSRDQSSAKPINFLDLRLETRSSRLETRDSKLSRIEARGTVNLLLSGTVCLKQMLNYQKLCAWCQLCYISQELILFTYTVVIKRGKLQHAAVYDAKFRME